MVFGGTIRLGDLRERHGVVKPKRTRSVDLFEEDTQATVVDRTGERKY